jgi:hypothetical protein
MVPDPTTMWWRKSSYSSGQGGACVELAFAGAVRDSKNPTGPVLAVGDLPTFLREIKRGRLNPN